VFAHAMGRPIRKGKTWGKKREGLYGVPQPARGTADEDAVALKNAKVRAKKKQAAAPEKGRKVLSLGRKKGTWRGGGGESIGAEGERGKGVGFAKRFKKIWTG